MTHPETPAPMTDVPPPKGRLPEFLPVEGNEGLMATYFTVKCAHAAHPGKHNASLLSLLEELGRHRSSPSTAGGGTVADFVRAQREWSERTFGPGPRVTIPRELNSATLHRLATNWDVSYKEAEGMYEATIRIAAAPLAPSTPDAGVVKERHPISVEWWRSGIVTPKLPREWRELCSRMVSELDRLFRPAIADDKKDAALNAINTIRNSIVGTQTVNWSEHVYPLVAALEGAGYAGMEYPEALENFGTLIERTNAAESQLSSLKADVERLTGANEHLVATCNAHAKAQLAAEAALETARVALEPMQKACELARMVRDVEARLLDAMADEAFSERKHDTQTLEDPFQHDG